MKQEPVLNKLPLYIKTNSFVRKMKIPQEICKLSTTNHMTHISLFHPLHTWTVKQSLVVDQDKDTKYSKQTYSEYDQIAASKRDDSFMTALMMSSENVHASRRSPKSSTWMESIWGNTLSVTRDWMSMNHGDGAPLMHNPNQTSIEELTDAASKGMQVDGTSLYTSNNNVIIKNDVNESQIIGTLMDVKSRDECLTREEIEEDKVTFRKQIMAYASSRSRLMLQSGSCGLSESKDGEDGDVCSTNTIETLVVTNDNGIPPEKDVNHNQNGTSLKVVITPPAVYRDVKCSICKCGIGEKSLSGGNDCSAYEVCCADCKVKNSSRSPIPNQLQAVVCDVTPPAIQMNFVINAVVDKYDEILYNKKYSIEFGEEEMLLLSRWMYSYFEIDSNKNNFDNFQLMDISKESYVNTILNILKDISISICPCDGDDEVINNDRGVSIGAGDDDGESKEDQDIDKGYGDDKVPSMCSCVSLTSIASNKSISSSILDASSARDAGVYSNRNHNASHIHHDCKYLPKDRLVLWLVDHYDMSSMVYLTSFSGNASPLSYGRWKYVICIVSDAM